MCGSRRTTRCGSSNLITAPGAAASRCHWAWRSGSSHCPRAWSDTPRLTMTGSPCSGGNTPGVRVEFSQVAGSLLVRYPGDHEGIAFDLHELVFCQADGLSGGNEIFADVAWKVGGVVRVHRDPQRPVEQGLDLARLQAIAHVAV